ncbi:MAG: hydrogenase maturation protease [Chlorobiales bacterium]|nr:hydrogenase maturation protease [Chlorobiales bacterium]
MKRINVLGLGNVIFSDEGFGVEAAKRLSETASFPPTVEIIDGGTQGIYLLDYVESPDCLLIFDAIIPLEYSLKVYTYRNDELPAFIHRKMSSHQMGLSELLSLAKLHDKFPKEVVLVGVPPQKLDMHIGLSEPVESLMEEALMTAKQIIKEWLDTDGNR